MLSTKVAIEEKELNERIIKDTQLLMDGIRKLKENMSERSKGSNDDVKEEHFENSIHSNIKEDKKTQTPYTLAKCDNKSPSNMKNEIKLSLNKLHNKSKEKKNFLNSLHLKLKKDKDIKNLINYSTPYLIGSYSITIANAQMKVQSLTNQNELYKTEIQKEKKILKENLIKNKELTNQLEKMNKDYKTSQQENKPINKSIIKKASKPIKKGTLNNNNHHKRAGVVKDIRKYQNK